MHNLLSPRDLVSRPDNMDETVLHTFGGGSLLLGASFDITSHTFKYARFKWDVCN